MEIPPQEDSVSECNGEEDAHNQVDASQTSALSTSTSKAFAPVFTSPLPPINEWPYNPMYIRMIEEDWILTKLKKQQQSHSLDTPERDLPSHEENLLRNYSVNYPTGPLIVKGNTSEENDEEVYSNPFETPYFKGKILIRIGNLGETTDVSYFTGRRRHVQACIQGLFKESFSFSEVLTGQVFEEPLNNLPPSWLVKMGFAVIRRLSPNLRDDISGDSPYVLAPMIATAQSIHIAKKSPDGSVEDLPSIIASDIPEDLSLLGDPFSKGNYSRNERKIFFSDLKNLAAYRYSLDHVYTFDFYQHFFDPGTYKLDFGITHLDISPYMNNQPVEIMALIQDTLFTLDSSESKESQNWKETGNDVSGVDALSTTSRCDTAVDIQPDYVEDIQIKSSKDKEELVTPSSQQLTDISSDDDISRKSHRSHAKVIAPPIASHNASWSDFSWLRSPWRMGTNETEATTQNESLSREDATNTLNKSDDESRAYRCNIRKHPRYLWRIQMWHKKLIKEDA
ncbi:hypothetical protein IE077_002980 [Cardiosporidium cionae]|uniref:Domain of unknown function at the cortex 1 domain-containing protein n=1 Tax=Cardiosporidium cionae TaxID=476202 RepID=A0ABQ7J9K0_9APIC|nr:hypothetical protein IE077_002980 [Cardiosporidium cionae]|eukprot:KAF8820636.1 hypothetical protein IE077_002980 [Cardiosporidium cionae]